MVGMSGRVRTIRYPFEGTGFGVLKVIRCYCLDFVVGGITLFIPMG